MPHVSPIEREARPEFEAVFGAAERMMGFVPQSMLTMAHKPAILGAFTLLTSTVFHTTNGQFMLGMAKFFRKVMRGLHTRNIEDEIPPPLQQMIAHVCSLASGCRYCQAHTAGNASKMSVPEEKIQDLLKFDTSEHFTGAERAALALAFAAGSVPNRSSKEHFVELRKHFNEKQIVHIVSVIALFGFLNRWNDTMATALEEHPKAFGEKVLAQNGWEAGKHAPEGVGR